MTNLLELATKVAEIGHRYGKYSTPHDVAKALVAFAQTVVDLKLTDLANELTLLPINDTVDHKYAQQEYAKNQDAWHAYLRGRQDESIMVIDHIRGKLPNDKTP